MCPYQIETVLIMLNSCYADGFVWGIYGCLFARTWWPEGWTLRGSKWSLTTTYHRYLPRPFRLPLPLPFLSSLTFPLPFLHSFHFYVSFYFPHSFYFPVPFLFNFLVPFPLFALPSRVSYSTQLHVTLHNIIIVTLQTLLLFIACTHIVGSGVHTPYRTYGQGR